MDDRWKLYVMGCRGSFPVCGEEFLEFGGATSCYILKRGGYALLLDCGSGLYGAGPVLRDCDRVEILLTHLHYDHMIGLLDYGVLPKGARVRLFATFGQWFGKETLHRFMGPPFWPYTPDFGQLIGVESPGFVDLEEGVRASFFPSNHPDDASLLRVDTDEGSVCAAFDYEHASPFPRHMADGCGLLLYDAMYTSEEYPSHRGWGHSCWEEGCALARDTGARRLIITHHDPKKDDAALRALEKEAQAEFPGARFARMGDVYPL